MGVEVQVVVACVQSEFDGSGGSSRQPCGGGGRE